MAKEKKIFAPCVHKALQYRVYERNAMKLLLLGCSAIRFIGVWIDVQLFGKRPFVVGFILYILLGRTHVEASYDLINKTAKFSHARYLLLSRLYCVLMRKLLKFCLGKFLFNLYSLRLAV